MADRPKSSASDSKPHSDHAAGTYSKSSKDVSTQAGDTAAAQHENRFAEVTRKSREARERLNAASQVRAERRESVERDRDYVRGADEEHPAPFVGAHSSVRGQRPPGGPNSSGPKSAIERAAALLDGDTPREEMDYAEPAEAGDEESA
jgi:hypothetical protein